MSTATAVNVENPRSNSDLNSTPPVIEDASKALSPDPSGGSSVESTKKLAVVHRTITDADAADSVTDIQRKMKRAERFGVPVQLSEVEKINSRAERFGTASIVNGVDSSKSTEELKRKARAERFGTVPSEPSDEESKKKARLARFGSLSKTDSVDEEKKKARAIRFSQLESGSKVNEKRDIQKTAITSKPGGGT